MEISLPVAIRDVIAIITSPMDETQQREVCERHGVDHSPPHPGSRAGVAIQTLNRQPLNGMRIESTGDLCGWFLWAGEEPSSEADFYQPVCVEHLADTCPAAIPFLALPPGWRSLADGDHTDVWYDSCLIG